MPSLTSPSPIRARAVQGVGLEEHEDVMQSVERDRLADEIQGTQAQALARLALGRDARHGDDGDVGLADGTQLKEIEAAHAGELDIQDDRVRPFGRKLPQRGLGATNEHGLMPELAQKVAENLA